MLEYKCFVLCMTLLWSEIILNPTGRGAAHIHGVLWLDLKGLKVKGVNNVVL